LATNSTIDNVAQLAGVSIKTVSRVINKEPNVRDVTRDKVLAAIEKLSYRPSPSARSLAGNRSYLIGLVYDNPSAAYIMDLQSGVMSVCQEEGFNLLIHRCEYQRVDLTESLIQLVRHSHLDGLILTPPVSDMTETVQSLSKAGIRIVNIAPLDQGNTYDWVSHNESQAAFEMTQHLIELNHHKIGFIVAHPDHGSALRRHEGYRAALKKSGIKYQKKWVQQGDFSFESGEEAGRKLLALKDRPSAIFASNDYMAAGVMKAAYQLNLKVPQDVSIAGFDDAPVSRQIWPSLTTVKQPVEKMSNQAAKILISNIRQANERQASNLFSSQLIIRESTAPLIES